MTKYIFIILSLILLSGCASISSTVQTYHVPNLQLRGKTFAISPIKKFNQENDLMFDDASKTIVEQLEEYGMHHTRINQAQIVVQYFYKLNKAEGTISPSRRAFRGKATRKSFYPYYLYVNFYDRSAFLGGRGKPIYQAVVRTVMKKHEPVMIVLPFMIKALFYDFPAQDGTMRSIKIKRHQRHRKQQKLMH